MITNRIRVKSDFITLQVFKVGSLFTAMDLVLSPSQTFPSWIVPTYSSGVISFLTLTVTSAELSTSIGQTVLYFTEGGSPPTNDARLIIEVVESLENAIEVCDKQYTIPIEFIDNSMGLTAIKPATWSVWWNILDIDDYIFIDGGAFYGYYKVLISNSTMVVLDLPYSATINPYNYNMIVFSEKVSTIVWVNQAGGRSTFLFTQRIDKSVEAGESLMSENGRTNKYFTKGKYKDGRTVFSTGISDEELLTVASLKKSIQAWEYFPQTNTYLPIIIDKESFNTTSSKNKFNSVTVKYKYAKYTLIQNQ